MRIIAGEFKGRKLASPDKPGIRPTAARVRESLFNILTNRLGAVYRHVCVLDLFAGSGGLGIEALSRGADHATFVDSAIESRALLRRNIHDFGLAGRSRILRRDATSLGPVQGVQSANLVFVDPPYGMGMGERAIHSAMAGGWVAESALIVLEESRLAGITRLAGLERIDHRTWGDTQILVVRAPASPASAAIGSGQ